MVNDRIFKLFRFFYFSPIILIKFIIPNFFNIYVKKKIIYSSLPISVQKFIFSGKGKVFIGENCRFGYKYGGRFKSGDFEILNKSNQATVSFGNNVLCNNNMLICCYNSIEIGHNVLIGNNVSIFDFEAHGIFENTRYEIGTIGEVKIGNNVWIGNNVTILKNTVIGDNCIVATGAVVSGIFTNNVIVGGIPAKVIKKI